MKKTVRCFVPRYFPDFSCKMGACRSACCVGWPVSVSMNDYFALLGLDCRRELRERLDVALHVADRPTEEEYAQFTPNWLGDCPMRMEDGRCSIQAELGEEALSDVCRLYPRGVRLWEDRIECSASNSCEKTLELLWDEREPMTFDFREVAVVPPPHPGKPALPPDPQDSLPVTEEFRFSLIRFMQDRNKTVGERIRSLRPALCRKEAPAGGTMPQAAADALGMFAHYVERSSSIRDSGEAVLARYGEDPGRYAEDAARFERIYPDWELFFEQMLVNQMFFVQFPYIGCSPEDAWKTAAAMYGLLRIHSVGTTAVRCEEGARPSRADLIDLCAASFRLIAHTPFAASVPAALGNGDGSLLSLL